ncbi:MAG: hypothetical protein HC880_09205 [Bacteroidia bacterium]|nr:hypothetical protein [Bacteroidia bacterium]
MLEAILLFLGGVLAASPYIIKNNPNAHELINRLAPAQGLIGIILIIAGIIAFFEHVSDFGFYLDRHLFWGFTLIFSILLEITLGLLLSYHLIEEFALSNNRDARRQGRTLYQNLSKYQIPLGLGAMGVALLWIMIVLDFTPL